MTKKYEKPEILVSTYGNRPPKAAESFGGNGVTTLADIKQATDARREVKPGVYGTKR